MLVSPKNIVGVDVFLERSKTRILVGKLQQLQGQFHFAYEDAYFKMKNILSLGPEFPLTKQEFFSVELFPTFLDRLPDPENPSYKDYCTAAKVPVTVTDPIVLLATVGKRGPSSFIYEPIYKNEFSFQKAEQFMEVFSLSLQDFAYLFDVSLSVLQKIKAGDTSGKEILLRLEMCLSNLETLEYQIHKTRKFLHYQKLEKLDQFLNNLQLRKAFSHSHLALLTTEEVNYTQDCLQALQGCSWAQALINEINEVGFVQENMLCLFKVRFAYHLLSVNLQNIQYGYKTGVGDGQVTFLAKDHNSHSWLIELTRFDEYCKIVNDDVPANYAGENHHFILPEGLESSAKDLDIIMVQKAILSQVAIPKEGELEPTKFSLPKEGEYNIIIVDVRGCDAIEEMDYLTILYGSDYLQNNSNKESALIRADHNMPEGKAIIGIFDIRHCDHKSKYLQERINGVGFIAEKFNHQDKSSQLQLHLFHNPTHSSQSFRTTEELRAVFPLFL